MAEFCKDCFRSKILTYLENQIIKDEQIIMSEELDFCEGCCEWKPVVIGVKNID